MYQYIWGPILRSLTPSAPKRDPLCWSHILRYHIRSWSTDFNYHTVVVAKFVEGGVSWGIIELMEALMRYSACNNVYKQPHPPSFPRSSPSVLFSVCFSASCLACPDKAAVPEDYSSMSGTCSCPPDLLASHRTRPVWKQTLKWQLYILLFNYPPPPPPPPPSLPAKA